jgi:hypothetical protein
MKKRFTSLFLCTLFAMGALAQKPTAVIKKASVAPEIDGIIDDVWTEAPENYIDRDFFGQVPTVGPSGSTTWQGLWTDDGMYVLLVVDDDAFYPWYAADPPDIIDNSWMYDKSEIYFDVNYILEDGGGPLPDWIGGGNGHYQIEPAFTPDNIDGTLQDDTRPGHEGIKYAFMVSDPAYIAEYFVPFSVLINSDGGPADLTGDIGFDVYIIDRDPGDAGERNAVWANTGGVDGTQSSWNNMDECGIITFEGAVSPVYIDEITLTGGEITENNGTLQMVAEVLPAETTETLKWTVEDGADGGRAKISKSGKLTAVLNGTVTVTASSLYADASVEVTISNQIVTMPEINLIRNGYFDDVDADGYALEWSNCPVIDGVAVLDPPEGGVNVWDFTVSQQSFGCNTTDQYWFTFGAWADEPDTFNVDFEDIFEERYTRYGTSNHEFSNGTSDWTFVTETEPTKYDFDVVFDGKLSDTQETLNFMLGWHDPVVYLDSIILYNENDLAKLTQDYVPVESIKVTGEGGASSVPIGSTLQMSAEVLPSGATLTGVNWTVVPGTGYASINASGLLTGDTVGMVSVIASAKDDSKVWNHLDVYVSWPESVTPNEVSTLKVFPNPAVDELNVVLPAPDATVRIYNSMGQKIEEISVIGTEHRFNISGYASGLYFVKSGNTVVKFVK